MTEDEAKTKWCPMVRFHNGFDGDVYCSRPTGKADDHSSYCIASDCAIWEEETTTFKEGETKLSFQEIAEREDAGDVTVIGGHCGLVRS